MTAMREDRNVTQVIIGLGVLVAGVLFTLDNMGVIDVRDFLHYWPIVFIAIGVSQIIRARYWSAYAGAVIWMLAGVWFLGRTTGVIRVSLGDLWPLLLAVLGAFLMFRGWQGYGSSQRGRDVTPQAPRSTETFDYGDDGWATPRPAPAPVPLSPPPAPLPRAAERSIAPPAIPKSPIPPETGTTPGAWTRSSDNTVNLFVVMGGVTRRLMTQDFKGGTAVAIMGGCKIDLRDASISQGDAVIDVLAFWGGVEIKVPEGWTVVPQVFPFMGGFDDRTRPIAAATRQRLIVRGLAFMGGIEVKH
jgi:predicted membrane protein